MKLCKSLNHVPSPSLVDFKDVVAIEHGRLVIAPLNEIPAPSDWLMKNRQRLLGEIAKAADVSLLEVIGHSIGSYVVRGDKKAAGLTLQFMNLANGQACYTIFNVDTCRARTTRHGKAGTQLPKGQFRVSKGSAFFKFWQSTGLPIPNNMSNFHERLGRLAEIVHTGEYQDDKRLIATSIKPLTWQPVNQRLVDGYPAVKKRLVPTVKELPQTQAPSAFQPLSPTGPANCGTTVIRERGDTKDLSPPVQSRSICVQDAGAQRLTATETISAANVKKCLACDGEGCGHCGSIIKAKKTPAEQATDKWLEERIRLLAERSQRK